MVTPSRRQGGDTAPGAAGPLATGARIDSLNYLQL